MEHTTRLQEKEKFEQQSLLQPKGNFKIPKLDVNSLEKPLISVRGNVASVDASKLLTAKDRKSTTEARKVEDPVASRKLAQEV